jgi:hypothetical protein
MLLNGGNTGSFTCAGGCPGTSVVRSDYEAWLASGKIAGDFGSGPLTVSPSLAVFGGRTKSDHSLHQEVFNGDFRTYDASTSLNWSEVGARWGLNMSLAAADELVLGLGGHLGFARRHVSFSGNDRVFNVTNFSSTISTSAAATPFLANAEASVGVKPMPNVLVKGFAGLNYDSKVPGIAAQKSGFLALNNAGGGLMAKY